MRDEVKEAIEKEKQLMVKETDNAACNIVEKQQIQDIESFKESNEFKDASKQLAERKVLSEFKKEALAVLSTENENQLQEYILKKEKERLDYIMDKEKPLIREKAKADLMEQRKKIAEQRYGYLYKREIVDDIDENGNKIQRVQYKDFTSSKFLNTLKELATKYNNLSDTTKKVIWTTFKTVLIIGAIALVCYIGFKGISALINSGILQFAK